MHPMFVKLFLEADADDLPAEEEERRRRGPGGVVPSWSPGPRPAAGTAGRGP